MSASVSKRIANWRNPNKTVTLEEGCPEISVFEITLLHPQGIYHAGELLQGYVTLVLSAPLTLHGLTVRFVGGANTKWPQVITRHNIPRTFKAKNHEIYFDVYKLLFGKKLSEDADMNLEPYLDEGNYDYPFDFPLPTNIPSSFQGPYGHVRYTVEATVNRPWSSNILCVTTFTVVGRKYLSTQPLLSRPIRGEASKKPGLLVWFTRPVSAWLETDKRGYVPGEFILLKGKVINNSLCKVSLCTVALKMKIAHFGYVGHQQYTVSVMTDLVHITKDVVIRPGDEQSWDGEKILVPFAVPSAPCCCKIIEPTYTLEMRVYTPPWWPLRTSIPLIVIPLTITIGTVPTDASR